MVNFLIMKYTDQQLINQVEREALGFDGWKKGAYDIWVRKNDTPADMDKFNDKVYSFVVPEEGATPVFKMVCTGTSHAGSYGLKNWREYNSKGCAVLRSNTIVYESHVWGRHKNYTAYRQAKPFPYFRDDDCDNLAEEIGPVYWDIIFANCHRAAAQGESVRIYNWSVACLVRNNAAQWFKWLGFMDKEMKRAPLSVCILKEF